MSTPKLQKFYKSRKWSSFVDGLRNERVTPDGLILCEHCGQPITKAYDCIGHHITELTDENVDDVNISLNPDNIKLVHFRCHNAIHNRFQGYQGRKQQHVYIVYGAPLAGKSEYVAGIAEPNDIVISMDRLWRAIRSDKSGDDKPAALKTNVFGLRDALLDMIELRIPADRIVEVQAEYGEKVTAWRLDATLREFQRIEPVDLFFTYPLHELDAGGILREANLEENERSMENGRELGTLAKKAKKIDKKSKLLDMINRDEEFAGKRKSYQQLMAFGENGYTKENYDKYCEWWGVYVLQDTTGQIASSVYSDYKSRWSIETYNNYVKNDADFNDLKNQDYYCAHGFDFIMLITGLIHSRLNEAVKRLNNSSISMIDILIKSGHMRMVLHDKTWKLHNTRTKDIDIFQKMGFTPEKEYIPKR